VEIVVVDEGLERSEQRNIGIARAKGEYILFADSDWELHPRLIDECVAYMPCAVYIPEIIKTKGWFAKLRNWERQFYTGTVVDVVRFVKKENCPQFDIQQKGTEDSDWDRRIKGRRVIAHYPYYHRDNIGIISYFKKKVYYTQSIKRFIERNPNDKILDLRYRCFWIFIENGKWKKLFAKPHYTFCLFWLLLIRGIIYWIKR
jgi:glycosyltransferase involved in cell wall biosynthesis